MAKLFLLRHLKSQWNKDNRFAGWVDNPLSKEGILAAKEVAASLIDKNIDAVYASSLIRNLETVLRIFENVAEEYPLFFHLDGGRMQKWGKFEGCGTYIPVYISESLNERYYGNMQGWNKNEVIQEYGNEQVHLWRREFNEKPPGGESLKDVYKRAVPFFKKYIAEDLSQGRDILVVASHNSLRALVKYLENISDEDIAEVELPFGALRAYEYHPEGQKFVLQ